MTLDFIKALLWPAVVVIGLFWLFRSQVKTLFEKVGNLFDRMRLQRVKTPGGLEFISPRSKRPRHPDEEIKRKDHRSSATDLGRHRPYPRNDAPVAWLVTSCPDYSSSATDLQCWLRQDCRGPVAHAECAGTGLGGDEPRRTAS